MDESRSEKMTAQAEPASSPLKEEPSPAPTLKGPPGPPQPTPPAGVVPTDLANELYKRADNLETKLTVASDNGLFKAQQESFFKILNELVKVYPICLKSSVSGVDYSEAIRILDTSQDYYDSAIRSVGWGKTLVYVYAVPMLVYLFIVLGLILSAAVWKIPNLSNGVSFLYIPKKIFAAGAIGALLQDFWNMWQNVSNRVYRQSWTTLYLLSPVLGALLGGVIYLAFLGGILVSTPTTTFSNLTLPILLAIVAGYNWQWAIDIIENIAKAFSVKQNGS